MLGIFFRLAPALSWSAVAPVPDASQEQIAVNACIAAVQTHFPCEFTTRANSTCLCEQHLWQASCFDNHDSTSSLYTHRAAVEVEVNQHCRAAGSMGADMVERQQHLARRQIDSILSSIGGDIHSFFSSVISQPTDVVPDEPVASATLPVPAPARTSAVSPPPKPSAPAPAVSTPNAKSSNAPASASSAHTSAPTPAPISSAISAPSKAVSNALSDTAPSAASTSAPSSTATETGPPKSGASAGAIAGGVVGALMGFALIAMIAFLILRHKQKRSTLEESVAESLDDHRALHPSTPPTETVDVNHAAAAEKRAHQMRVPSLDTTVPPTQAYSPVVGQSPGMAYNSPMAYSPAVEIDGVERPAPVELPASTSFEPRAPAMPDCLRAGNPHGR